MKRILPIAFFCIALYGNAQFNIRLVVSSIATKANEDIYVAGNFNNWNPADEKYKLKPFASGRKSIVIKELQPGSYAFKFTRGSWDKVECLSDGRTTQDRIIDVNEDVSQELTIAGWKDDYPDKPKPYTASPQVRIMDTAFNIPTFNRKRRIWLYLPKGYAAGNKTYPVLYMQDGQNLFNEQTANSGEWGVDECLDSLQRKTGNECIVVGIDNGADKRMSEYSPYNFTMNQQSIKAEGKQYVDFIVQILKPFIDNKYRTKKGAEYTSIAGSSMGGLISLYALLQYPEVFGSAGVFSPSFWITSDCYIDAEKFSSKLNSNFYFYAGGKESATMVGDVKKMATILGKKNNNYRITTTIDPNGIHNESNWRREFPAFYLWLMNN
jgi:metallo-beta-lactamase class B